jgi:hypothetical protein
MAAADKVSLTLRSQLGASNISSEGALKALPFGISQSDVLAEMQEFSSLLWILDHRAQQLNAFTAYQEADPFTEIRKDPVEMRDIFEV